MTQLLGSILEQVSLTTVIDIGITALLIYWLFSLIRGTRAVRLVIGVSVLIVVYALAVAFDLVLLTRILQAGAVVGPVRPRRRLPAGAPPGPRAHRPGRIVRLAALAGGVARVEPRRRRGGPGGAGLSADGHGALIVIERETGLEEVAETGIMIHGDLSADLLRTIFSPRTALHDGAVIIRGEAILAAGAVLPLAETTIHTERFGTRHRAALGIAEQTDALVVVVSEENGQVSLVERSRIVRNLNEPQLAAALRTLLDPTSGRRGTLAWRSGGTGGRAPRMSDLGRFVGRTPTVPPRGPSDEEPPTAAAAQAPR